MAAVTGALSSARSNRRRAPRPRRCRRADSARRWRRRAASRPPALRREAPPRGRDLRAPERSRNRKEEECAYGAPRWRLRGRRAPRGGKLVETWKAFRSGQRTMGLEPEVIRERSGRRERFGRPVETAGVGAVERGGRLYGRGRKQRCGNDRDRGKDGLPAVADRIATVGEWPVPSQSWAPPMCPGLGVLEFDAGPVKLVSRCRRHQLRLWRAPGGPADVPPREHRRRRRRSRRAQARHGCKQPRRPRFGDAAHRDNLSCRRSTRTLWPGISPTSRHAKSLS